MRAPPALAVALVAATLLAGCTTTFPEGADVVAELEVGNLAAGERAAQNFTLDAPAGFLAVGFRTGPGEQVHVTLRAPDGRLFDTAAANGPCVVTSPAAGAWALEVRPDPFGGELRGGKFTVRAAPGEPPSVFACRDDTFPGRGGNATLLLLDLNITAGQEANATFDQPWNLTSLGVQVRGDLANATVELAPPGGDFAPAADVAMPPAHGAWRVRVTAGEGPVVNATLAVQGTGA